MLKQVHKFMDLGKPELDYFISQVGAAAASFGVAKDDITAVADALNSIFNVRCGPPTTAVKANGDQLQSICIADNCMEAKNPMCDKYEKAVMPSAASSGMASGTGSMTMSPTGSSTGTGTMAPVPTGAAAANGLSLAAAAVGVAAFFL